MNEAHAVCDGNPHSWNRTRRCDAFDSECPEAYKDCGVCEGVGGIAYGDKPDEFKPAQCTPIATAEEMKSKNVKPIAPIFPENFINTGFHEVQIFVKRGVSLFSSFWPPRFNPDEQNRTLTHLKPCAQILRGRFGVNQSLILVSLLRQNLFRS